MFNNVHCFTFQTMNQENVFKSVLLLKIHMVRIQPENVCPSVLKDLLHITKQDFVFEDVGGVLMLILPIIYVLMFVLLFPDFMLSKILVLIFVQSVSMQMIKTKCALLTVLHIPTHLQIV